MKTKVTVLSAAVFLCVFFGSSSVLAQCENASFANDPKIGYIKNRIPVKLDAAETKKRASVKGVEYTHIYVFLRDSQRFKVKLDGDHVGDFSKTNDLVPFTVLENVYGHGNMPSAEWVPDLPDPEDVEEQRTLDRAAGRPETKIEDMPKVAGHWKTIVKEMKCLLIPKDSKIYGMVDHANSRYPFNIKRKGKLFITLNKVKLAGGSEIPLTFAEAEQQGVSRTNTKSVIRDCRRFVDEQPSDNVPKSRKCIVGRRGKFQFPTAVIGETTTASIVLAQDKDDKISEAIGFFSVFEAISKATGVDGFINPPNAVLKAGMIFDVMTEKPGGKYPGAWMPIPKPPAKEAEKKEEDK